MKNLSLVLGIIFCSVLVFGASAARGQVCPGSQIINSSLDGANGPFQDGRLFRDALASTCAGKPFPGPFNIGTQNNYIEHVFAPASSGSCVTVNFNVGTCGTGVFAGAYLNSYNPLNLGENYIGDLGASITQSFSFQVPAGNQLVLVATSVNGVTTCDYSFTVDNYPCLTNVSISLSPLTATNETGTQHTVTATVIDNGSPAIGTPVAFRVISGPNNGQGSDPNSGECSPNNDCTTNADGQVSWTYTGFGPGTDRIVASIDGRESTPVEKIWLILPSPIPTLSEWGLIALAGVMGLAAMLMIQRRKARVQ